MRRCLILLSVLAACGEDDSVHHLGDAPVCTPSDPTIEIVAPTVYACRDPFKSKVSITNNTCENLLVQSIRLTAAVTAGACGPAGPGTYQPMTMGLQPGETGVLLDLTSGPFCCRAPGCPASLQCDESFTFEVTTSAGVFTSVSMAHLNLDGCNVVCP
ncbi:MAG: hypothetical protein H0T46_24575 [Deltaproteobacteria bacterium]|nr:hypothetical protein [Deltaproteobacteria bacterium]